jgi:L-fucose isomerase-like protein
MIRELPKVKIGFVPANRGFFSQELAEQMRNRCIKVMEELGIEFVVPGPELTRRGLVENREEAVWAASLFAQEDVDGIFIYACNFGDETSAALAATFATEGIPIFVAGAQEVNPLDPALDRLDSFCGVLSISKALHRRRIPYSRPRKAICFPEDPEFKEDLATFADACRVVSGFEGSTVGAVGPRPIPFETCEVSPSSLRDQFGIEIVQVDLLEAKSKADKLIGSPEVDAIVADIKAHTDTSLVHEANLRKIASLEQFLKNLVDEWDLDALGIQCWTLIQEVWGISACLAMSRMTMHGVPTACEVDLHGALTMHLLRLASGVTPWLGDWNNQVVSAPNTVNFWHCGVFPYEHACGTAKVMEQSVIAASVGEGNAEGTIEFRLKNGPVTLARLNETLESEFMLLIEEGEIIEAPGEARGSYGFVQVPDLNRVYNALLDYGFIHHGCATYGRVGKVLYEACRYLGILPVLPNLELDADHKRIMDW